MGIVYLIHFDEPYYHARHYLGYTDDLDRRLQQHAEGNGSKLMRAIDRASISWRVARVWRGKDRKFERLLKNRKKSRLLCPICRGGKNYESI